LTITKKVTEQENHRRFSIWDIYCFVCIHSPLYITTSAPTTRTCTEMTMRVLTSIFGLSLSDRDCFGFTPEAIYKYVKELEKVGVLQLRPPPYTIM
jgi:hypothetical protein